MGGRITFSHGITPSVATIEMVPQPNLIATNGTLAFTFGGTTIEFHDCRADKASLKGSPRGGFVWTIHIFDRRWKWQFGGIDGHYNLRNQDGSVRPGTEKDPQTLASMLLAAMNESGFDVSALPNDTRPEVHWSAANPARELADLCEKLDCRVVLGLDNLVRLLPRGIGLPLPTADAMNTGYSFDSSKTPDELIVVGAPTLFQGRFKLEAVGRDTDGKIKPIGNLSYTPAGGWPKEIPGTWTGLRNNLEEWGLAEQTVCKWYRIIAPGTKIPGEPDVAGIDQVTPLQEGLAEEHLDAVTGKKKPNPPIVTGTQLGGGFKYVVSGAGDKAGYKKFRILRALGIVEFEEVVVKPNPDDHLIAATDLVLEIAFPYKDANTREPRRYKLNRVLGSVNNTPPRILRREDIQRTVIVNYGAAGSTTPVGVTTNDTTDNLTAQANYYMDAAQAEYANTEAGDIQYAGLVPISPDGAIQQVTFDVGRRGTTTRASRNREHSNIVTPWKERRRREKQRRTDDRSEDQQTTRLLAPGESYWEGSP